MAADEMISLYSECTREEKRLIDKAVEMSRCSSLSDFVRRACVVTAREVIERRSNDPEPRTVEVEA